MQRRHFCADNVIVTVTTLTTRIQALIDFVVLLGNSASCTLTKGIVQHCQNLGTFKAFFWLVFCIVVCLFGLGGPEKSPLLFWLSPLLSKIVGSWEITVL